jgi:hypothetical protein
MATNTSNTLSAQTISAPMGSSTLVVTNKLLTLASVAISQPTAKRAAMEFTTQVAHIAGTTQVAHIAGTTRCENTTSTPPICTAARAFAQCQDRGRRRDPTAPTQVNPSENA